MRSSRRAGVPVMVILIGAIGFIRSSQSASLEEGPVTEAKDTEVIARFEVDLEQICLKDGRRVGTAGHAEVQRYLVGRLGELGLEPYAGESFRLPFERDGVSFTNVVGVVPGEDRSAKPLLIGAHYDSVIDAPCADDNAAAVCIALEVARRATQSPSPRDVVIALFDAEEPPWFLSESMGSIRFYQDQADDRGFHAALILDLVGHDVTLPIPGGETLRDLLFVMGCESHADMKRVVEPRIAPAGLKVVVAKNEYVGDMSDHHVFREHGVPYLFLSCGRWQHYHQPTDTVDRLNLAKMARIVDWLGAVAGEVASAELAGGPPDGDFTVELECRSLTGALSSIDPDVRAALGMESPSTRAELDEIADALLRAGL